MVLHPLKTAAEFYKYTDKAGTVIFVDDPSKIPKQYRNKKETREDSLGDPRSAVMRVRIIGNQVLVPVILRYEGREAQALFLLDTGATVSTMSPALASRLGITKGKGTVGQVAGGALILGVKVKLDSITVGPNTKSNMDVVVLPNSGPAQRFDGLLGMNFLRDLRYNIDFDNHIITWEQ